MEISSPWEIGYLVDHPEFIPLLVQWHHQEWSYLRPGDTIETRTARLHTVLGRRQLPTVLIAFSGDRLLGSAMLLKHDMDTREDLSPWLAGVYVAPAARRKGIARKLVQKVTEEARLLGFSRLYLYTPSAKDYYLRLGWSEVERTSYRQTDVVVMTRELV